MDDVIPRMGIVKRPSTNLIPGAKSSGADAKKEGNPISFKHLGKGGYDLTLYASTPGSRKKWLEHIGEQQAILRARGNFYNRTILSSNFFAASNRVNCVAPFGMLLLDTISIDTNISLTLEYLFQIAEQRMLLQSQGGY
jgi:hypothetical protein